MLERTGLPAALAALIIAAASAANADPEMAAATPPVATAPKADVRVAPAADKADAAASEPDDEDSQAEVDKSAAELEDVRKAEEKAGLLPAAPGTAASGSGNENSSTKVASAGRAVGHFSTPWAAGMKAMQRSASSRNSPR